MADTDESIIGLLLRAHAQCAAQSHGEQYVFQNTAGSQCFDQAKQFIATAIKQVNLADGYSRVSEYRKQQKNSEERA